MAVDNNKLIMMKIKSIEMKETAFGRKFQLDIKNLSRVIQNIDNKDHTDVWEGIGSNKTVK